MEASNVKAMREALKIVLDALKKAYATLEVDRVWLADNIDIITAALAAPPRNCDVGTAEKQHIRFRELCRRRSPCSKCPVSMARLPGDIETSCAMIWAQMPYEGKGAKSATHG